MRSLPSQLHGKGSRYHCCNNRKQSVLEAEDDCPPRLGHSVHQASNSLNRIPVSQRVSFSPPSFCHPAGAHNNHTLRPVALDRNDTILLFSLSRDDKKTIHSSLTYLSVLFCALVLWSRASPVRCKLRKHHARLPFAAITQ